MTDFRRVVYHAVIVFAERYGISLQVYGNKKMDFQELICDIKAQEMI